MNGKVRGNPKKVISITSENTVIDIISFHSVKLQFEPVHEISNNVVCSTSKASDQPAHTRSLIRAFTSRWSIL